MISPVRVWFLGRTSSIRADYRELREAIPVRRFGLEFSCIDLVLGVIGAPPSPAMSSGVAELFKHALFPFFLRGILFTGRRRRDIHPVDAALGLVGP